jgi:predicted nucleotidyltransferase component of viral defense system
MAQRYGQGRSKESLESFLRDDGAQFGQDRQSRHLTFVFRRLLDRVFHSQQSDLQLKGGMALRMRTQDARFTTDLDLTSQDLTLSEMRELISVQAQIDFQDSLKFEVVTTESLGDISTQPFREGAKLTLSYSWGGTLNPTKLRVDMVRDKIPFAPNLPTSGLMEPPLGLPASQIKLFALSHQIAQKVCACLEVYSGQPASRAKDLVDLVIIARSFKVDREELLKALEFEFGHRNLTMPSVFKPNPTLLQRYTFDKKVTRQISLPESAEQAVALVNILLGLDGGPTLNSVWDPVLGKWVDK